MTALIIITFVKMTQKKNREHFIKKYFVASQLMRNASSIAENLITLNTPCFSIENYAYCLSELYGPNKFRFNQTFVKY